MRQRREEKGEERSEKERERGRKGDEGRGKERESEIQIAQRNRPVRTLEKKKNILS